MSSEAPRGDPFRDDLVRWLVETGQDGLYAVLHFGSTLTGASPGARSAYDLFVVVDGYGPFYRRFRAALPGPGSAGLLAGLNRFLPPNVLFVPSPDGEGPGAKVFVMSRAHLERELTAGARDHFCRGRLMQTVDVCQARSDDARRHVEALLGENRRGTLSWVLPFLRSAFSVDGYVEKMIRLSYGQEIRPEDADRVGEVVAAQQAELREPYAALLEAGVAEGRLHREADGYVNARDPGTLTRWRWRLYFLGSKVRSTLRWIKYVLTFDGWLDYAAAKVERRTGERIELTERERRLPFVFLWPKFFRVLRARRRSRGPGSDDR